MPLMSPASRPAARRQTRTLASDLRRVAPTRKQMLWGLLGAFVASAVLVGIGYATTPIPNPNGFATAQATTLYYSDGKTVLASLGNTTRVDVPLSEVPLAVR